MLATQGEAGRSVLSHLSPSAAQEALPKQSVQGCISSGPKIVQRLRWSALTQAAERAASSSEARAAAKSPSMGAVSQEPDSGEAHSSEQRQQQGAAKKPRARKRSRKK